MPDITTVFWFDNYDGEEAASFYCSVFPNSRITEVIPYLDAGAPGAVPGKAMVVAFELDGHKFSALNGGPQGFKRDESVSFQIACASQDEVDHYWDKLVEGGGEHGPCGWLKDRFGVSWQVTPTRLMELITDSDPETAKRATEAMLKMGKLDIATIEDAAAGAHA